MRVKSALVLYVAAEDPRGIAERTYGYLQNPPPQYRGFLIHDRPFDLTNTRDMKRAISDVKALIRDTGAARTLIVFDTLNLCIGDGDENSSRDMGRAIGNAQELARDTKAHVLIVHHTSAADAAKPRGSSALVGNADTLMVLRRVASDDGRNLTMLTQEKQRSQPKGPPVGLEIAYCDIGVDNDGDRQTVAMAQLANDQFEESMLLPASPKPTLRQLRAHDVLMVLTALVQQQPDAFHAAKDIGQAVGPAFEAAKGNPGSLRKAVKQALDDLLLEDKIETDGRVYRLFRYHGDGTHSSIQALDSIH